MLAERYGYVHFYMKSGLCGLYDHMFFHSFSRILHAFLRYIRVPNMSVNIR